MVVEIIGGVLSGSLALLADAGHMATDAMALGLAVFARHLAMKPPSARFLFGKGRAQVLAAFVNGLALFGLVIILMIESLARMRDPMPIDAGLMLSVAVIGLAVNAIAFFILHNGGAQDINTRGAVLHVIGDLLGSVAAIISAIVIALSGWVAIDPLVTLVVCALISRSAISLVREAAHVLLEGAPPGFDPKALETAFHDAAPQPIEVLDLRVWMVTPDEVQLTARVAVSDIHQASQTLAKLRAVVTTTFETVTPTIEIVDAEELTRAEHNAPATARWDRPASRVAGHEEGAPSSDAVLARLSLKHVG